MGTDLNEALLTLKSKYVNIGTVTHLFKSESSCYCLVVLDSMLGTNAILIETNIAGDGIRCKWSITVPKVKIC